MPWFSGFVLFASLWFLALFLVLPFGYRTQEEAGSVVPGTPRSAPERTRLGRKMLLATLLATVVWLLAYWVVAGDIITRDDMRHWDRLIRR